MAKDYRSHQIAVVTNLHLRGLCLQEGIPIRLIPAQQGLECAKTHEDDAVQEIAAIQSRSDIKNFLEPNVFYNDAVDQVLVSPDFKEEEDTRTRRIRDLHDELWELVVFSTNMNLYAWQDAQLALRSKAETYADSRRMRGDFATMATKALELYAMAHATDPARTRSLANDPKQAPDAAFIESWLRQDGSCSALRVYSKRLGEYATTYIIGAWTLDDATARYNEVMEML